MLFLGNSYTISNNLEEVVVAVFAAAGDDVSGDRLANPGWRFVDHQAAIETAGTAHATEFAGAHDWVILQEQSQIPGFPESEAERVASGESAVVLDGYAAATGAQTLFLMTWGRRDGDDTNPALFPDYATMQGLLTEGYLSYVEAASADGTPAWVAPAGLAWARVHADVVAAGGDPLEPTSAFATLYVDDGSHPSPRGTWLMAYVIYASVTGRSPVGLEPPDDIADADYLQEVAAAVVLEGEGITYPWTDAGDTGTPADTGDDTGAADTAVDIATAPEAEGCGCAAPVSVPGWIAGIGALALVGRRRR